MLYVTPPYENISEPETSTNFIHLPQGNYTGSGKCVKHYIPRTNRPGYESPILRGVIGSSNPLAVYKLGSGIKEAGEVAEG